MVTRLRMAQPSLKITDRDVKCVEVAGLCHDLGHGPFSHVWDNQFIPRALCVGSRIISAMRCSFGLMSAYCFDRPGTTWVHEDMSEMMLDYLVKDNNIDLKPDEVSFVKDLIAGTKKHTIKQCVTRRACNVAHLT